MPTPTPSFALVGSLTDLKDPQRFPLYSSPSARFCETSSVRGYGLTALSADQSPATPGGALFFEGASRNLLSYSNDLSHSAWVHGDGVDSDFNFRAGPSQTYLSDLINFGSGRVGGTQKITRTLTVEAGKVYKRSILLSWISGVPDNTAIATVTGGVASVTPVNLRDRLTTKNRWELVEVTFTAAGRQPIYPAGLQARQLSISAIAQNVITLTGVTETIAQDALVGGKVRFDNTAQTEIAVVNNGPQSNGSLQVTLQTPPPANAGITLSSRVSFRDADLQTVTLELSSNVSLSLLWGGEQVEETLRTTLIQTLGQPIDRAPIQCKWQPHHNPLSGRSFGLYLDLPVLRGNCRIVEFVDDLTLTATPTQIQATVGGITLTAPRPIGACKLFVQVSDEVGKASLYLNGTLAAQSPVSGFVTNGDDWWYLGGRETERYAFELAELAVFDGYVSDGAIAVGQPAGGDVAAIFTSSPIPTEWIILSDFGGFLMPPVLLPAATGTTPSESFVRFPVAPKASQLIEAIDATAKTVTLRESVVSYTSGRAYARDASGCETAILNITAVDPTNRRITVASVTGLAIGQELFQSRSDLELSPRSYLAKLLVSDPEIGIVPRSDGLVYRNAAIAPKTVPGAQVTVLL